MSHRHPGSRAVLALVLLIGLGQAQEAPAVGEKEALIERYLVAAGFEQRHVLVIEAYVTAMMADYPVLKPYEKDLRAFYVKVWPVAFVKQTIAQQVNATLSTPDLAAAVAFFESEAGKALTRGSQETYPAFSAVLHAEMVKHRPELMELMSKAQRNADMGDLR